MAKSKTKEDIREFEGLHDVPCELTEREKADAALVLAGAYQAQESLAIEKKSLLADIKQKADSLAEKIHKTSLMVQLGIEVKSINCELVLNYTTNQARLIRLDTKDVVEEREMTQEEKQRVLFPDGKKENKKSTKTMKQQVESEQLNFEKARKEQEAKKNKEN